MFWRRQRYARADRKEPVIALSRNIVGADFAGPALVAAQRLAAFEADAQFRGQMDLPERAGLDRQADLGQVGADIRRLALADEAEGGTESEIARTEQRRAEAFVGGFEREFAVAGTRNIDLGADTIFVGARP